MKSAKVIFSIFVTLTLGLIAVQLMDGREWYEELIHPSWGISYRQLQFSIFPIYLLMGLALGLVWDKHVGRANFPSYCFFYIQLGISFFWYIVLFRLHGISTAMALITIQVICLSFAVINFYRKSKSAGRLLLVSLAFTLFLAASNVYLLIANPPPHVGHWWTI